MLLANHAFTLLPYVSLLKVEIGLSEIIMKDAHRCLWYGDGVLAKVLEAGLLFCQQPSEQRLPGLPPAASESRIVAIVKSFAANVSLKPGLSVGTAQPESIYTAQLTAKFEALNPRRNGECEVLLPLPPQIISLADLAVTVNDQPSESVEIRGDKLVWFGTLPGEPTPMTITYSAVGKGLYNLQIPPSGILDTFHIDLTAIGSDVRMLELSLQPTKYARGNEFPSC